MRRHLIDWSVRALVVGVMAAWLIGLGLLALSVVLAVVGSAQATSLADLMAENGHVAVGELRFENFAYTSTENFHAPGITPDTVTVSGVLDNGLASLLFGIQAHGGEGVGTYDLTFFLSYDVTVMDPMTQIHAFTLETDARYTIVGPRHIDCCHAVVQTWGNFSDDETRFPLVSGRLPITSEFGEGGPFSVSTAFPGDVTATRIDQISMFNTGDWDVNFSMSEWSHAYATTVIPEPGSATLLLVGLGGLGWLRWGAVSRRTA